MLSNKTGVSLAGGKSQNQGRINNNNTRKVGVNSPTGNVANKSFVSTTNTQGQGQGQRRGATNDRVNEYDDQDYYQTQTQQNQRGGAQNSNLRANKSEILDRAWGDRQLAGQITGALNKTCCVAEHLPHNEMNPQCYRNSGASVGRIPYAG